MEANVPGPASGGRVVKRAADGAQAARIGAEAEVLTAGQIPGVVTLLAVEGDPERRCLVTARVDGIDLGRGLDLSVEEVAGVVAAVGTVLADLHDLGLVHGAVMASHVLVGPDGRPVLCGFGYGGRAGDPPVDEAPLPEGCRDPARRPGDPLACSADVYALGGLLRALVAQTAVVTARAGPTQARWLANLVTHRPRRSTDRSSRDALVAVADRATTADPRLRLGARSLAAAVGEAVPGASLPRRLDTEAPAEVAVPPASALESLRSRSPEAASAGSAKRGSRLALAGGLVAAVTVIGVGSLMAAAPGSKSRPEVPAALAPAPSAAPAIAVPTTTAMAVSTVPMVTAPPDRACPAVTASLSADTDADGCPEALEWNDGVLVAGDRRWAVGQAGDRVATADWSCSGRATLALLRPATGDVFVFDQWAQADHDLVARVAGRVEGGFALRAAELGAGCPRLAVERGNGPPVTLPGPPFPSP